MANLAPWTWGRKNVPAKVEDHPAYSLQREMNRLFEDFFGSMDAPFGFVDQEYSTFTPKVDVKETEKEIIVAAELPGLEEKDINVSLVNDTLTIYGEKNEEKEQNIKGHYKMERLFGSFRRSFSVPAEVEVEKVTAQFKNGVLTVTLPKSPEVQKKQKNIPITKA